MVDISIEISIKKRLKCGVNKFGDKGINLIRNY
jgi:hypothetical protein